MIATILFALAAALVTAAYFIFGHGRPSLHLDLKPGKLPEIAAALPLLARLTGGEIKEGNLAEIYQNGSLFTALLQEIDSARITVHLETYVWWRGEVEKQFVSALCRKAEEGLSVRVLIDAVGGSHADEKQLNKARQSGVEIALYRPVRGSTIRRFNNRTHRKLLIVDGSVGYTFGHGISDEWLGHAQDSRHWRDTGVRLQGPVVSSLQSVFFKDWIEASASVPLEPGDAGIGEPNEDQPGSAAAHVVSSSGDSQSAVALLYKLAIASARREIIIQNPYFAPDAQVPELLEAMAQSGVAVHLMVPGKHTDSAFVHRAGCHLYKRMLLGGVRVYEFAPTLLHQKIVIVDGKWSHVGSTNFDERSLALNAEIGVGILDEQVAATLIDAFQQDLKRSRELSIESWQKRPWYHRVIDWCAYQVHGQL